VILIVSKAISLANSPALTETEVRNRALDWYEVLFPIVPEQYLQQAFQRAVHDHTGAFPLSCYEVINAFKALSGEIEIKRPSLPESDPARNDCRTCFGTGMVHLFNEDGSVRAVTRGVCGHVEQPLFEPKQPSNVVTGDF
jgi:hypothetical protein